MVKPVVVMLLLAWVAAMVLPVPMVGPVKAQACGTEKGPPPPG